MQPIFIENNVRIRDVNRVGPTVAVSGVPELRGDTVDEFTTGGYLLGGHASKFYSVAEHSVHVSHLCLPEHALWGLLHDASEAYLVDLPRPLKLLPEFAPYREAERRLQRAVAVRFGLPENQPATVTEADDTMLWIDAHSLLGSMPEAAVRDTRPPFEITEPLLPVEAERLFLSRFKKLSA